VYHLDSNCDPLRFCIVSTFYPPYNFGGDGIYAHRLANGLARRGHKVSVIHSPSAYELLAKGRPLAASADHPNVTVLGLQTPLGKLGLLAVHQTGRSVLQAAALRRSVESEAFDVIHYNNVSLLGGVSAFGYGRGLKLCTLSDHWLVCPMHVLWRLNREVCTKPTCYRCTLAGGRPPQIWRRGGLMREATQSIDAFLGPSLFSIRMHLERGIHGTMIRLPLFCDEPVFPARKDIINGGRPYFLYAGRLEKVKGAQTIIPVLRARPEIDLLIAGVGSFQRELFALAGRARNIKFLGRVNRSDLQSLYLNCTATIVPSLGYETFGLVVAESFSAGAPVIVHAQGALAEMVSTYGGGLMYSDEQQLCDGIDRLRSDRSLREHLGREGRRAYEAQFTEDVHLKNYLGLARVLLANKRAGRTMNPALAPDGQTVAGLSVFFG